MRVLFLPSTKTDPNLKAIATRVIIESGCTLVSWFKGIKPEDFDIMVGCTDPDNDQDFVDFLLDFDEDGMREDFASKEATEFSFDHHQIDITVGKGIYTNYIQNDRPLYMCTVVDLDSRNNHIDQHLLGMAIDEAIENDVSDWINYGDMAPHPFVYNMKIMLKRMAGTTIGAVTQFNNNTLQRRRLLKWKK